MKWFTIFCATVLVGMLFLTLHTEAQNVQSQPYIWEFPFVRNIQGIDGLVTELREEIQQVLDAGRLAPLYISFADQESVGYTVYQEPGRIITTLAWAYPYLTPAQQALARAYVNAEFSNPTNAPWGVTSYGKNANSNFPLPRNSGHPRELHPKSRWWYEHANFGLNRPFLQTIYGVWLYAYRSGDWTVISNHWLNIKALYENYGRDDAYRLYGTMSVHVAMARLADRFGDDAMRTIAINNLQTRLDAGRDFAGVESFCKGTPGLEWKSPYGSYPSMYDARMEGTTYHGWMFLNLTPEIGRFLYEANGELRTNVLARHAAGKAIFPLWWMSKASYFNRSWTGDEGSGLVPEVMGMLAPIERWVVRADPSELAAQMRGAPNGIGDCYWLEALVQAIESHGTLEWIDVRNPAGPAPSLGTPSPFTTNGTLLKVDGLSSISYAVDISTNLLGWYPLATNQPGTTDFADTNPTGEARFYRARSVP